MADDRSRFDFFPATRRHALARLEEFKPRMGGHYASERNTDYGPDHRDNISCLSPFHAHRLLFEEETVRAALDAHGVEGAEKFIQEVYWRTYFKGWLEQHPSVWLRTKTQVAQDLAALGGERMTAYEQACEGRTGIACFDQWAAELTETGYLHNHARMWFASIWIFTLELPWSLGADFFYRNLLDGDAASNTLSWRWVAGLHTRNEPYVARASNIARYTDGRFDPAGELNEDPAPLEDDWNREAAPLPSPERPDPDAPTILLLHEDDLGFETLIGADLNIAGIAGITVTDDRSPGGVSENVKRFTIQAVEDALSRANEDLFVSTAKLANPDGLAGFAREQGATQVVFGYAPAGPVQDRLTSAARGWEESGLAVRPVLRRYDADAWPHCGKGFFRLKKEIPSLVARYPDEASEG